ncbi:hypothetical protein GCM10023224_51160 [Streptomonospora halophila]|uniref:SnoaL-like domain-containing protein n=1 Tax=Streptomonospora halophila TaxID=427369 RepID=A0ABP9H198_9ACTN
MTTTAGTAAALSTFVSALNEGDHASALGVFTPGAHIEDPIGAPPITGEAIAAFVHALITAQTRLFPGQLRAPAEADLACLPLIAERDDPEYPGHRLRISQVFYAESGPAGTIDRLRIIWGRSNLTPTSAASPRYTERSAPSLVKNA